MAIPINLGLPEQIEDILRIYEKVLGEETGIESFLLLRDEHQELCK